MATFKTIVKFLGITFDERKDQCPLIVLPHLGNLEDYTSVPYRFVDVAARLDRIDAVRTLILLIL